MAKLAILGGEPVVRFPPPHAPWPAAASEEELQALVLQRNTDILIRGRTGPPAALEDAFREFIGVRYAVTFNSGTSALYAAFVAVGVEPGLEVVGPALTYHAALSPAFALGAEVRLADIDPKTRCIDPDSLERSITRSTRAVVVVHQWGHPADMDRILPIVRRHGLKLIEDCSHAHGSAYRGKPCGTFGDAAIFSFQAKKAIYAGEGGILVTNDDEVMSRALLVGHPRERAQAELSEALGRKYAFTGFGMKLRMSPFNAIVALHSLRNFPAMKENRHRCLGYLKERLAEVDYIEPPYVAPDVDMGAWYGFKPLYRPERLSGVPRQKLVQALQAEGLTVDSPPGPCLATLPLYSEPTNPVLRGIRRQSPTLPDDVPRATFVADHALNFPTFSDWKTARPIMDAYIEGLIKVKEHARALAEWRA
jgi:dTDP-4-amino-4,6-dideoxygalactose transaminase